MRQTTLQTFRAARRVSTPLIHIETPDPADTIQKLARELPEGTPILEWRSSTGLAGLNPEGQRAAQQLIGSADPEEILARTGNAVEALVLAKAAPSDAVLFFHAAHRLTQPGAETALQAVWDLRDVFKQDGRTLVLLSPGAILPPEIASDTLTIDEPLPSEDDLENIILGLYDAAEIKVPDDQQTIPAAVAALAGLAAFPAEQAAAMSLTRDGLDLDQLWERKRRMISDTPGLSVYRGGERFSDLGGLDNAKAFIGGVLRGRRPPRAVVFIDEIEKQLAGTTGDLSGQSQDQLGTLLAYMQDTEATGLLCLGPPGSGKSALAKAAGNEAGIPTIQLDLGSAKNSLVGSSEARIRAALKVVTAVSSGSPLFIATCNSLTSLPPELRRRFSLGTFFFDLPTAPEARKIWELYLRRYRIDLSGNPLSDAGAAPPHEGWTGAEIRNCCDLADRLQITLEEAAGYIVPIVQSAAQMIEKLRREADGRFLSASEPGPYTYQTLQSRGRAISFGGAA